MKEIESSLQTPPELEQKARKYSFEAFVDLVEKNPTLRAAITAAVLAVPPNVTALAGKGAPSPESTGAWCIVPIVAGGAAAVYFMVKKFPPGPDEPEQRRGTQNRVPIKPMRGTGRVDTIFRDDGLTGDIPQSREKTRKYDPDYVPTLVNKIKDIDSMLYGSELLDDYSQALRHTTTGNPFDKIALNRHARRQEKSVLPAKARRRLEHQKRILQKKIDEYTNDITNYSP